MVFFGFEGQCMRPLAWGFHQQCELSRIRDGVCRYHKWGHLGVKAKENLGEFL